jgi:hypothetical protein
MRTPKAGVFLREVYLDGGIRGRRLFRGVFAHKHWDEA